MHEHRILPFGEVTDIVIQGHDINCNTVSATSILITTSSKPGSRGYARLHHEIKEASIYSTEFGGGLGAAPVQFKKDGSGLPAGFQQLQTKDRPICIIVLE